MKDFVNFAFVLIVLSWTSEALQCVDEDGNQVDWVIMYKLPREAGRKHRTESFISQGKGYAYLSSESPPGKWVISDKSVEDPLSLPGRILSPLYNKTLSSEFMFVLYNDEHPNGNTSFAMGHTKGVAAFDEDTGFWLIHSVPKYPPHPKEGTYGYPSTGEKFGQSFLCISIATTATADLIGRQFQYNHPFVYSYNFPDWSKNSFPELYKVTQNIHVTEPPFFSTVQFSSLAGVSFSSFAKFSTFGKDLYADLVSPSLRTSLMVESWPNGAGKMDSRCRGPFQVENIDEIDFRSVGIDFTTHHDHSKWAVSYSHGRMKRTSQKFVCIGDINRMKSQIKRGGGTVCFHHSAAWKAFSGIVKNIETCRQWQFNY